MAQIKEIQQWNPLQPNFSGSNQAMGLAGQNLSQAGNIFNAVSKNIDDRRRHQDMLAQQEIANQRADEVQRLQNEQFELTKSTHSMQTQKFQEDMAIREGTMMLNSLLTNTFSDKYVNPDGTVDNDAYLADLNQNQEYVNLIKNNKYVADGLNTWLMSNLENNSKIQSNMALQRVKNAGTGQKITQAEKVADAFARHTRELVAEKDAATAFVRENEALMNQFGAKAQAGTLTPQEKEQYEALQQQYTKAKDLSLLTTDKLSDLLEDRVLKETGYNSSVYKGFNAFMNEKDATIAAYTRQQDLLKEEIKSSYSGIKNIPDLQSQLESKHGIKLEAITGSKQGDILNFIDAAKKQFKGVDEEALLSWVYGYVVPNHNFLRSNTVKGGNIFATAFEKGELNMSNPLANALLGTFGEAYMSPDKYASYTSQVTPASTGTAQPTTSGTVSIDSSSADYDKLINLRKSLVDAENDLANLNSQGASAYTETDRKHANNTIKRIEKEIKKIESNEQRKQELIKQYVTTKEQNELSPEEQYNLATLRAAYKLVENGYNQ